MNTESFKNYNINSLFHGANSVEDWYTILAGLVLYLENNSNINPITIIGSVLYHTLKHEMFCFVQQHDSLIYIHEFLTDFYSQKVFSLPLAEYFQLVDQIMLKNEIYGQQVFKLTSIIKRYNTDPSLETPEMKHFDCHEEFVLARMLDGKYTHITEDYTGDVSILTCCYNPEQLARYRNLYLASCRRFGNTKAAMVSKSESHD